MSNLYSLEPKKMLQPVAGGAWIACDIVQTMAAPRWKFWMARMFGVKWIGRDDYCEAIIYAWRGKNYVWSVT